MYFSRFAIMTSTVTTDEKHSSGRILWLLVALFTTQVYVVSGEDPPQQMQQLQQSQPQKPQLSPPSLFSPLLQAQLSQPPQLFQQPPQQQQQSSQQLPQLFQQPPQQQQQSSQQLPQLFQQPPQQQQQSSQQLSQLNPQSQPQQQVQSPLQQNQPQLQQLPQSTQQLPQPQFQQLPQLNPQSQPQQVQSLQQQNQPQLQQLPPSTQQLSQPQFQHLSQLPSQPQQQIQSPQQLPQPQFQQQPQLTQQLPQQQLQQLPQQQLQQLPQSSQQPQSQQQIQSTLSLPQPQLPQLSLQPLPPQQVQSSLTLSQPSLPPQLQQQPQLQSQFQQKFQKLNDRPNLMEPLSIQMQSVISDPTLVKPTSNIDSKLNPSQQIQSDAMTQPTNTPQNVMAGGLPQGSSINQQQQDSIPSQGKQGFNLLPMKNDVQFPSLPDTTWMTSMPQQFTNAIPIDSAMTMLNPMPYAQQSMQMATNTVDKLREYGTGVKNGVGTFALDVGNKLIDVSKSMVNMATVLPNAILDQKKKTLNSLADMLNIPQSNSARSSAGNMQLNPQSNWPNNNYYSGYGNQPGLGGAMRGSYQMGSGGYQPQMQGVGYGGYQGQLGGAGYPYQMSGTTSYGSQMSGGFNGQRQDQFSTYPQQQQQQQQWPSNRNSNFGQNGPNNPVSDPQPINRYSSFSNDPTQM